MDGGGQKFLLVYPNSPVWILGIFIAGILKKVFFKTGCPVSFLGMLVLFYYVYHAWGLGLIFDFRICV